MRVLADRGLVWTVFAGGMLQTWVQFPAEAVPFALFGQLFFPRNCSY